MSQMKVTVVQNASAAPVACQVTPLILGRLITMTKRFSSTEPTPLISVIDSIAPKLGSKDTTITTIRVVDEEVPVVIAEHMLTIQRKLLAEQLAEVLDASVEDIMEDLPAGYYNMMSNDSVMHGGYRGYVRASTDDDPMKRLLSQYAKSQTKQDAPAMNLGRSRMQPR